MKKALLTLGIALCASLASFGVEKSYTIDFKTRADNNGANFTTTTALTDVASSGADLLSSIASTTNCANGMYGLKVGQNKNAGSITLNLAAAAQVAPTKIELKVSANKSANSLVFKFNDTQYSLASSNTNDTYATITVPASTTTLSSLKFERATSTAQGFIYVKSITVTYEEGTPAAVKTPEISLVEGEYGFNAEITCETEGAEIFYTTDGTEPTAESTKYNAPFEVWEKCTIKAIAIKGEDKSGIASFDANPPMVLDGFSALLGIEDTTIAQPVIVKGNMTAVYKNGANLYVECGGSYMLFYSNSNDFKNMEFTNGDTFKRVEGTFKFYSNQPEIENPTFGEITTGGEAVAAKPYPVEYINEGMMCQYLIINPVSMTVSGKNITFTDLNGNELVGYNKFNLTLPTETTGKYYTVTGFVGKNGENLQFLPTEFEEVTVETVETPVIEPAPEGSFDIEVNKIEITCATEDAEIFYTLDGSDPDMDSEYYNGPISIGTEAQFTVKAIAYKEGWLPSAIATAEYKNVTGIEDVVMGSNEAVEYFNLQGVRVAEPAAGLYIRRQGNKVEKVTVK